jgi:hypothetical protein
MTYPLCKGLVTSERMEVTADVRVRNMSATTSVGGWRAGGGLNSPGSKRERGVCVTHPALGPERQLAASITRAAARRSARAVPVSAYQPYYHIIYPFPATTLSIRSDTNTASHRSRWFQRFGTIPGSLDIYYAIYAR